MKSILAVAVAGALASGCVAYPVEQSWETRYKIEKYKADVSRIKQRYRAPDVDKASQLTLTCDRLGFNRGSDGHRLCMLRGIDRYVDHQTAPLSERYLTPEDEITVEVPRAERQAVPQQSPSALVPCHVDPRPPCIGQDPMPDPWTYGGQASPPGRP